MAHQNPSSDPATRPVPVSFGDVIRAMAGRRVVVVGDIMLDRFVHGDVSRISPESPVPVLSAQREVLTPGGAGNVLANLAGLGAVPVVVGLLGEDDAAETFARLVGDLGCDVSLLVRAGTRPTTVKTRFMTGSHHMLRVDQEDVSPVADALAAKIIDNAVRAMDKADAVILSDYGKGVLGPKVLSAVIEAARARGIPVLADPKGMDYTIYRGADVVTPNRRELSQATAMPTTSDDDVVAAAQALLARTGIRAVVATRSEDGMTVLDGADAVPLHLRTQAREVYDVVGAGDTVIAVLAAALAAGADLPSAAHLANLAGGIVVGKIGTAPIDRDELLEATGETPRGDSFADWGRAAARVAAWRQQGLKVGFTNGCFDILHAGHVSYLQAARARCDRLVVALNCDESVRRLKGPERPVNDEQARATVLGALSAVDMVVLFARRPEENDNPLEIIKTLTPSLLVKGADYTVDTVIGADYVISQGGEVWLAPLEPGKSTTDTIRKMKGAA